MRPGDRIVSALEEIGFKRTHVSVRSRGRTYHIHVIAGGKRFYTQLNWPTNEPVIDWLRRKLPCPNGLDKVSVSDFMAIRAMLTSKT